MSIKRKIPITNKIAMFLHCKECLDSLPDNTSPREHAAIEAGWTKLGLQLWCKRHDKNILHVDFEGQKHPANLHARGH